MLSYWYQKMNFPIPNHNNTLIPLLNDQCQSNMARFDVAVSFFLLVYCYYYHQSLINTCNVSSFKIGTGIALNHIQQHHGTTLCWNRHDLQRRHRKPQPQKYNLSLFGTTEVSSEYASVNDQVRSPIHVIVVGGGVGGLAIASRLIASASHGTTKPQQQQQRQDYVPMKVTILEKNSETGGRCGSFDVRIPNPNVLATDDDDEAMLVFRHERGPSLLLLPQMYQQLFTDVTMGTKVAQDFGLYMKQCIPAYTVIFDDGDRIHLGFPKEICDSPPNNNNNNNSDSTNHMHRLYSESRTMMNQFERDGAQKWDDYMRLCRAYLECGVPNFIEERLDLKTFPNFIVEGVLRNLGQSFPLKPHRDVLDTYFSSEKMCALASFQDLYVGLQPFRSTNAIGGGVGDSTAPAVFGLLSAIELHPEVGGVYAPIGGFRAVQESLQHLATSYCNVTIQYNCTAVRVTNHGVHYYNTTPREETEPPTLQYIKGDVIVINADLPYAEESLLQEQQQESKATAATEFTAQHPEKNAPTVKEYGTERQYMSLPEQDEIRNMKYDWNDRYQFSSGVIAFHWSVNQSLEELNTHNVFLSATNRTNAYQSWNYVRNVTSPTSSMMTNVNEPFNFYVHRASKTDPTAAPKVSIYQCFVAFCRLTTAFLIAKQYVNWIGNGCDYDIGTLSNVTTK
jgi:phytoene dehydrogenase-like protein